MKNTNDIYFMELLSLYIFYKYFFLYICSFAVFHYISQFYFIVVFMCENTLLMYQVTFLVVYMWMVNIEIFS